MRIILKKKQINFFIVQVCFYENVYLDLENQEFEQDDDIKEEFNDEELVVHKIDEEKLEKRVLEEEELEHDENQFSLSTSKFIMLFKIQDL